ncbi:hypothetical protein [Cohnella rhizosphaerae]|uniref:Uncharacterized protein n=1 Tax=Cohnella rhizosphaerae TaxID=1457232 RepID=A0A9X4KTU6_9BACL|nr:hypothetical protein [Cohnella rhizosphaerae]MDG0810136.1 hypothetical protein [Cohnella rhizosphaerae]
MESERGVSPLGEPAIVSAHKKDVDAFRTRPLRWLLFGLLRHVAEDGVFLGFVELFERVIRIVEVPDGKGDDDR